MQAKTANNKLEVIDNRVFVIDHISLLNKGFMLLVKDIHKKESEVVVYQSREDFDKEWRVIDSLSEAEEYKCYDFNDKHQD